MNVKRDAGLLLNLFVVISALLLCLIVYATLRTQKLDSDLKKVDPLLAQTSCDTSVFAVLSPAGRSFAKSCIVPNGQIYSDDLRFRFFLPNETINNLAYVQTSNIDIKDSTTLSWSITTQRNGKLFLMTRHIPGLEQAPQWISQGFSKQTTTDLSHIDQFFKRKNEQGLIGLYDIYMKNIPAGTVQLGPASSLNSLAYSMYITAFSPNNPSASPTPTSSPTPTATPDPLLEIAKQHNKPTDCYTVYDNGTGRHLYDITTYIRLHPGVSGSIASACGADMTDRYNNGDVNYKEIDTGLPHRHTQVSNDILDLFKLP